MSEISKVVAASLYSEMKNPEEKLIFPAPCDPDQELQQNSELNVANMILAQIQCDEPKIFSKNAHDAANACWRQFAMESYHKTSDSINTDIWNEQIDDVLVSITPFF